MGLNRNRESVGLNRNRESVDENVDRLKMVTHPMESILVI